jgi:hypothetical protein
MLAVDARRDTSGAEPPGPGLPLLAVVVVALLLLVAPLRASSR